MRLKFTVNVGEAFRRGFSATGIDHTLEVTPEDIASLSAEERDLIAKSWWQLNDDRSLFTIDTESRAPEPTLRGLAEAIKADISKEVEFHQTAEAWISEHGSDRLKLLYRHKGECDAWSSRYSEEVIAKDFPGWTCDYGEVEYRDIEYALRILEEVRETVPQAKLFSADEHYDRCQIHAYIAGDDLYYRWPD